MTSLSDFVPRLSGRRVLIIGDVMLDHFLVGQVDRISPEAPVPVVRFSREEFRLGGAANVANNVAALGGLATLVGLVGADDGARQLRRQLAGAHLDAGGLVTDASRPTTRKVRVVTSRNQQVARLDYEGDADATGKTLETMLSNISRLARSADAIVLSDYRKGVVGPAIITAATEAATTAGVPLLVDPKVPQVERYRGVGLITPNHHEAEQMTQTSIRSTDDVRRAARLLHDRTGANVLITWGEQGMWVLDHSSGAPMEESLTATAREVADVTGAGDTVIAVLALGLAAGAPLALAARLANLAAGLVVARFGPVAITPDELGAAAAASDR